MTLLGIDIGGTKVVLTLGDRQGRPIRHQRRATQPSGDWRSDLERILGDARALLADANANAESEPLDGIGISAPGPCDPWRGVISHPPNLPGWQEVPIAETLAAALSAPTRLENDANAAALAEWRFGAGRGSQHLAYLTMSTGVGGGLILDGRLYRGAFGGAGEVGHFPIEEPGLECACGRRGCLEAYCGGNAWQERLRRETPDSSQVLARAGHRTAIRPEHLVAAARAGDAFACAAFERWVADLCRGLAPLVMLLEPERIVLGTIAVAAGEALCFAPLRRRLDAMLWPHQRGRIEIVPAELGDSLPQYAGLAVALEAGTPI